MWWSTIFVSLAWELCSQTSLLFLIPCFFLPLYRHWMVLHGADPAYTNRNTTLPSTFLSRFSRRQISTQTPHQATASHNGLAVTQWLRDSFCLLDHCKLGAIIGCKGSNEHRISSNPRLCLHLLIFPHTERSKCISFGTFFSFHFDSCRPKCQSSSSSAHLRYWMCN